MEDPIVESILKERYYQPGESSWNDIAKRVADFIGNDAAQRDKFYQIIKDTEFIPNSPCLMNAGTKDALMSACFSIGIDDDLSSIFDAVKCGALLMKAGAGVGYDFSTLRPKDASIRNGQGTASGVVSFMRVFNSMIGEVKSGFKRRGAAIAILRCDHPEIYDFISCKDVEGEFSNFNISVMLTKDFMDAVKQNKSWELKFNNTVYKTVNAKELFNQMVKHTHGTGEPGYLHYENINNTNPNRHLGDITSCNPCGEIPILVDPKTNGGESCNLGSIDVSKFYNNGVFDWNHLKEVVNLGVNFLNNVMDKNHYPFESIKKMTLATRKIGLGVMGVADLLIKEGLEYGSQEACNYCEKLMKFINDAAIDESIKLAKIHGPFPAWKGSEWEKRGIQIRNSVLTCQAPTGTVSLFANCSSGIEPNFGWIYKRSTWVDGEKKTYDMIHPLFKEYININHIAYTEDILSYALLNGTLKGCPNINWHKIPVLCVAKDISWKGHCDMQIAFQKYTGNSISKTQNLPNNTTVEQVSDILFYAFENGCKGLTIYREGSRNDVVLETNASKKSDELVKLVEINNPVKYKLVTANGRILPKTPRCMPATLIKKNSGCGKMMIAIGEAFDSPHSVTIVNKGGCDAMTQALAELTALGLRWGIPGTDIVKTLKGIKCSAALRNPISDGKSCPDILGKVIDELYEFDLLPNKTESISTSQKSVTKQSNITCPECGELLSFIEGCRSCSHCGFSKCN